jgi:hypothetical protein
MKDDNKDKNIIDKNENIINKDENTLDKNENIINKDEGIIDKNENIINKDENIIYKKFIHSLDSLNFLEFNDKNKYDNISPICLRYHKYIFSSISIFFIIKNIYFITK